MFKRQAKHQEQSIHQIRSPTGLFILSQQPGTSLPSRDEPLSSSFLTKRAKQKQRLLDGWELSTNHITSSVIPRAPYCIRVPFPPSSTTREGDVVKSRHLQTLPHPRRPTSSPTANHGSTQSRTDSSTSIPPKQAISSNPRRSLRARELPLTEELPARPAPSKAKIRGDEQR